MSEEIVRNRDMEQSRAFGLGVIAAIASAYLHGMAAVVVAGTAAAPVAEFARTVAGFSVIAGVALFIAFLVYRADGIRFAQRNNTDDD